jgi:hypothetical protein
VAKPIAHNSRNRQRNYGTYARVGRCGENTCFRHTRYDACGPVPACRALFGREGLYFYIAKQTPQCVELNLCALTMHSSGEIECPTPKEGRAEIAPSWAGTED